MGEDERGEGRGERGGLPQFRHGSKAEHSGWWGRRLPAGEGKRKLVHAGTGLFALALPFLTWQQAALCAVVAFLFNWLALPRLLGHRLTSARPGVSDRGVLLYPLVVLALIVLYRNDEVVAFGWGVLAFGDAAAGIVGQKWGRHVLPWNQTKTWEGLLAFCVAAAVGGSALSAWAFSHPASGGSALRLVLDLHSTPLLLVVPVAMASILESVPHGADDNLLPPIASSYLFALFLGCPAWAWAGSMSLPDWRIALGLNTACAVVALLAGALRPGGVVVAWALGVVTWMAFGIEGFVVLLAFLVAGLLVTFIGYGRKGRAGTAEPSGGRRGGAEVFGKGGVLLLLGLFALTVQWTISPRVADFRGWWGWVVVAILAAATADTWATEIGGLWGRRAFTLLPMREVPPGTPGAVSLEGLLAAVAGAAVVSGLGAWLGLLALSSPRSDSLGPSAVVLAVVCTLAAFVATVIESLLPRLGPASHVGKNLVVTLLAPILVYAVLGVLR